MFHNDKMGNLDITLGVILKKKFIMTSIDNLYTILIFFNGGGG
jgi:hypothetical protein